VTLELKICFGDPHHTLLWECTALPRPPSWIWGSEGKWMKGEREGMREEGMASDQVWRKIDAVASGACV